MDATALTLIEMGEQMFAAKVVPLNLDRREYIKPQLTCHLAQVFITAIHCLWVYDYFLTLGDEIRYAWNGKRSWVFALFIANRYSPVFYIVWSSALTHGYTSSFCQDTKWLAVLHTTLVAVLSQITITLRIYAVTDRNKWLGGALSCLIAAQLVFGIYFVVWVAASPTRQVPAIDLDPFRICIPQSWKFGGLLFVNIAVAFDVLAFLSILITAKKLRQPTYPGIPSLLDAILRDATIYFIPMVLCQVSADLFISFAPDSIKDIPGLASTVLIPLMTSRLMLSLKKSAREPVTVWSPSNLGLGMCIGYRSLRFASQVPGGSGGVPVTPIPLSVVEGSLELESTSYSY